MSLGLRPLGADPLGALPPAAGGGGTTITGNASMRAAGRFACAGTQSELRTGNSASTLRASTFAAAAKIALATGTARTRSAAMVSGAKGATSTAVARGVLRASLASQRTSLASTSLRIGGYASATGQAVGSDTKSGTASWLAMPRGAQAGTKWALASAAVRAAASSSAVALKACAGTATARASGQFAVAGSSQPITTGTASIRVRGVMSATTWARTANAAASISLRASVQSAAMRGASASASILSVSRGISSGKKGAIGLCVVTCRARSTASALAMYELIRSGFSWPRGAVLMQSRAVRQADNAWRTGRRGAGSNGRINTTGSGARAPS